jgi:hypothetical protein
MGELGVDGKIIIIYLRETVCKIMDRIHLVQDMAQWATA